jgi:menaquinone-dependent protoporphyrinogen IX oxidase
MRTAVVFFPSKSREKVREVSRALADGIGSQGHDVDVIDGSQDVNTKLTIYTHVAVVAEQRTLFTGHVPESIREFLANSGIVGGKKSFAFVIKKPIGNTKALKKLMHAMEHEGMFLRYSDVLATPEDSRIIGSKLKIAN